VFEALATPEHILVLDLPTSVCQPR
jgi:hypothetical protein